MSIRDQGPIVPTITCDFAVASSTFVIADGADTSGFSAGILAGSSIGTLSTTSTTPTSRLFVPREESSDEVSTDTITIVASMFGGTAVLVFLILLVVSEYRRARRRREQPRPSSPDHSWAEATRPHLPSLVVAYATSGRPDANRGVGGTDPIGSPPAPAFPLVPNRRPPSSLLSEPATAIPPYMPQPQTRELIAGSIMEVSTIASRPSTAPSDAPSSAGLMGTFSSCPPSYATSPSHPPSYVTGTRTSSSAHLSYASSS